MKYRLKKDLPWAKAGEDLPWAKAGEVCEGERPKDTYYWVNIKGLQLHIRAQEFSDWFEEVDEQWKPRMGDTYYFFENYGTIVEDRWSCDCDEMVVDEERWKLGNCFRTRELAERAAEEIKALLKEFHKKNV